MDVQHEHGQHLACLQLQRADIPVVPALMHAHKRHVTHNTATCCTATSRPERRLRRRACARGSSCRARAYGRLVGNRRVNTAAAAVPRHHAREKAWHKSKGHVHEHDDDAFPLGQLHYSAPLARAQRRLSEENAHAGKQHGVRSCCHVGAAIFMRVAACACGSEACCARVMREVRRRREHGDAGEDADAGEHRVATCH